MTGFHLRDGKKKLHEEVQAQLLRKISDDSPLTAEHTKLLTGWMTASMRSKRLEGLLPAGTPVAH